MRTWRVTVTTSTGEYLDHSGIETVVAVVMAPTAQLALRQLVLTSTNVEAIVCIHVALVDDLSQNRRDDEERSAAQARLT